MPIAPPITSVPNAGARSVMPGRSGMIGANFPTGDNAIFAKAIDALQRRPSEAGQQLLIATCDYDPDAEMRQAVDLVARGADALALCGTAQRPELLEFLRHRGPPRVHVMTLSDDPAWTTVRVPAEEMWRTAADRLLAALRGEAIPRHTQIEVSLVVRGSTAAAPRK
jgi:DNA-binding LacI/PurR family transcriptional regulator